MSSLENISLAVQQVLGFNTEEEKDDSFTGGYNDQIIIVTLTTTIVVITTFVIFLYRAKVKSTVKEVKELVGVGSTKPRFRKRDKVLFYGRKMLRKVKLISGQVTKAPPGKRKKIVLRFAKKLLQLRKDNTTPQLQVLEPPAEYLQENLTLKTDQRLPQDVLFMLKSIRIFGHFEKPFFLELCRHMEAMYVPQGDYLFTIGASDDNFYVVQSGKLNVFITEADGGSISLKLVKQGDSITSLLSFTDVLTGHTHPFRTVSAQAMEDSKVLRLPVSAFQEIFEQHPETFVRVIQVIMVRLQRVTFTALHRYLGLSSELFTMGSVHQRKKSLSYANMSPTKRMKEGVFFKDEDVVDCAGRDTTDCASIEKQSPTHELFKRKSQLSTEDENTLLETACQAFVHHLGLEDNKLIEGRISIRDVPAGTYLSHADTSKEAALVLVLHGCLSLSQRDKEEDILMFHAVPGEIVGALSVLTGEPSFFTIRAKATSRIAILTKNTFYNIMTERPKVVLHVAHTVVRRLSAFVRQIDFALDWEFLASGESLYKQGEESDCTYIVLCGRLRSVITHNNGRKQLVAEYGRGDLIGIVETLTQTPRSTSVMAVRDSELAKLPSGLLNAIKLKFPLVVTTLINLLGHRILGTWQKPQSHYLPVETKSTQENFATIALIPVSDDVPLHAFTYEMYHCLSNIGDTLRLTSDYIIKVLGANIMDGQNEFRLSSWLAQQEDQHRMVLYQCDYNLSPWTQCCIRQADCILIIGKADNEPSVGKIEKYVEDMKYRAQKELVFLHREGGDRPRKTVAWLNMRTWCSSYHHIQCPKRMFAKRSQNKINEQYSRSMSIEPNIHSDFARLARWLTGNSVGLVLGGGGARGAAHVGMIKAILEAGIPIDMVGGVSIGAFMGALWCMEKDLTTLTQKAREWCMKMTQRWRQVLDLTYPITAMFTGAGFNHVIHETFGETLIEDLWLPFFTVTTDISCSSMRIHTHGCLWRYCRASMSLSGYMPPLCDPSDNHLLLDGGYVNNLPADVMRQRGARYILAIDVGSQDDTDLTNYGDSLSGWWLLWKRYNPFSSPIRVPDMSDIQSRLAYVSCVRQLEEVKNSDYCKYIRPPIDRYKTLQFGSFDEIKDVGYNHGKAYLEGLKEKGALTAMTSMGLLGEKEKCKESSVTPYTFTDLAQMVCKVPALTILNQDSEDEYEGDEEDQEAGYMSEPSAEFLEGALSRNIHHSPGRRWRIGSLSFSDNELESDPEFLINSEDRNWRSKEC